MGIDPATTLTANLESLTPATRRAIESATEGVQIHATHTRTSASIRTAEGRWVRVHSGQDPLREAEQFLDRALHAPPPAELIVIGPGLGYVLDAIERRSERTKVIAIEPLAAMARAMLERRDWRDRIQTGRLTILVGPEYLGAPEASKLLGAAAVATPILEHPVLTRELPIETARARGVAAQILRGAESNAEARRLFARRYLLNTLKNLPAIVAEEDVSSLRNRFRGIPAIVVGAGPSLDNHVNRLRAFADRTLIIAVDTALRPLQAAGIQPHLVVSVDPSELNARHLTGMTDTYGTWLVGEGSLDCSVFPQFAGRAFGFRVANHHPWPWLAAHGLDRGTLRAWGSVLTTAFDLACETGCDPIVFLGADLAYTGGQGYCRNTIYDVSYLTTPAARAQAFAGWLRQQRRSTCQENDLHGAPTLSTPNFVQFRDWLLSRAAAVADRRVLNATGAGILHGPGIAQVDVAAITFTGRGLGLHARLDAAWRASLDQRIQVQQTLERALLKESNGAIPFDAWLEFAGDSASAEQIRACTDIGWTMPPVIMAEPANLLRLPGWSANFRATASGRPTPSIQWQVSTDGLSWADVSEATATTYSRAVTAEDDGKQFRALFINACGSKATAPAVLTVPTRAAIDGFNAKHKLGLLWRNSATGGLVVWDMDGITRTAMRALNCTEPDAAWTIAGTSDFNGDGKPDILWHNATTGAVAIWLMDGIARMGLVWLDTEEDLSWRIAGIGDFNGDDKPDILWRNSASGANRVWYLDGERVTGVGWLKPEAELTWRVAAVADFNGDRKPDILWHNTLSGASRLWYMDRVVQRGLDTLDTETDLAWTIAGALDFNADGKPDILWRNVVSGANRVWHLHGVTRTRTESLDPVTDFTWLMQPGNMPSLGDTTAVERKRLRDSRASRGARRRRPMTRTTSNAEAASPITDRKSSDSCEHASNEGAAPR